jgi:LacI family transcriptional regulator
MSLAEPPTAVFAASETQALGVLEAARSAGRSVPDELSVIGFDDIEAASYAHLSTVRQPLYDSGMLGARLLLGMLAGTELAPVGETLALELVIRATTAPPQTGRVTLGRWRRRARSSSRPRFRGRARATS